MTAAGEKPDESILVEIEKTVLDLQARHGVCMVDDFVEAATPEDSPLHHLFEWNDSLAAHKYRRWQARVHIRRVTVECDDEERAPRFVHATIVREGMRRDGYVTLESAMADVDKRAQVLREARAGLNGWRQRLAGIQEAQAARMKLAEAVELLAEPAE